jgi:hypothetical protein
VPLVSTYTPTPTATATTDPSADPSVDPDTMSDPAIGDDPTDPYMPGGTPADPCEVPGLAPNMTDEAGEPLCDDAESATGATSSPTGAPTGGATKKPGQATTVPTASPSPTSDSAAAGPLSCAKSMLSVRLKADRDVYSGSTKPKLFLGVKNSGPNECLVDMGSRALSFTIISGKDRVWSSDDCQGKGTRDIRLLKPGQTLWARAVWGKVRSSPGCPKGMAAAKPGYYVVDGSAGGVKAQKRAVFRVD